MTEQTDKTRDALWLVASIDRDEDGRKSRMSPMAFVPWANVEGILAQIDKDGKLGPLGRDREIVAARTAVSLRTRAGEPLSPTGAFALVKGEPELAAGWHGSPYSADLALYLRPSLNGIVLYLYQPPHRGGGHDHIEALAVYSREVSWGEVRAFREAALEHLTKETT